MDASFSTHYAGLDIPLFAYSFLIWINYSTPVARRATAVGWFWFTFSLGLSVIGPFFSSMALPVLGEIHVLWVGLLFVLGSGLFSGSGSTVMLFLLQKFTHSARVNY